MAKEVFTPTKATVLEFETIFQANIEKLNRQWVEKMHGDTTYLIYPQINRYKRQYSGFYDRDHQQRLFVIMYDEKYFPEWKSIFGILEDAGRSTIAVEFVIETKRLERFTL